MSENMNEKGKLAEIYKTVIENKIGSVAKIDDDGDITFKIMDMGFFYISVDEENDPEFFRLVFPFFYSTDYSVETEISLQAIANEINIKKKSVKIVVIKSKDDDGDTLYLTATNEAFLAPSDTIPKIEIIENTIFRYVSSIRNAIFTAKELINKNNNKTTSQDDTI